MTDTDTAEIPATGSESPVEAPMGAPEGGYTGEPQRANKEARYRVERNEAREALAAAQERISQLQRLEVERLASQELSNPADVFTLSGVNVSDLINGETGAVDHSLVQEVVAQILESRPLLRATQPAVDPTGGLGGRPNKKPAPSWATLIEG